MSYDKTLEISDRLRRIETRLTKFMTFMGFETMVSKPTWTGENVDVPSPMCSIKEILETVPQGWAETVTVFCRGEFLMDIYVTPGEN